MKYNVGDLVYARGKRPGFGIIVETVTETSHAYGKRGSLIAWQDSLDDMFLFYDQYDTEVFFQNAQDLMEK
jgi:hypothetical protein